MVKSKRLRYLLFVSMLLVASWIGYWVGYVTTRTEPPTSASVQGMLYEGQLARAKARDQPYKQQLPIQRRQLEQQLGSEQLKVLQPVGQQDQQLPLQLNVPQPVGQQVDQQLPERQQQGNVLQPDGGQVVQQSPERQQQGNVLQPDGGQVVQQSPERQQQGNVLQPDGGQVVQQLPERQQQGNVLQPDGGQVVQQLPERQHQGNVLQPDGGQVVQQSPERQQQGNMLQPDGGQVVQQSPERQQQGNVLQPDGGQVVQQSPERQQQGNVLQPDGGQVVQQSPERQQQGNVLQPDGGQVVQQLPEQQHQRNVLQSDGGQVVQQSPERQQQGNVLQPVGHQVVPQLPERQQEGDVLVGHQVVPQLPERQQQGDVQPVGQQLVPQLPVQHLQPNAAQTNQPLQKFPIKKDDKALVHKSDDLKKPEGQFIGNIGGTHFDKGGDEREPVLHQAPVNSQLPVQDRQQEDSQVGAGVHPAAGLVRPDQAQLNEVMKKMKKMRPMKKPMNMPGFGENDPHYALVHAGKASRVHGKIHATLRVMDEHISPDNYIFTSKSLPADPRLRPSIANGHVGTAVHRNMVFMNGLYNGRGGQSSRAAIPSTCAFNVTGTEPPTPFNRTYTLNVGAGVYSEQSVGASYNLTQRLFAHRVYNRLLVAEVDLVRSAAAAANNTFKLNVDLNKWQGSSDITFHSEESGMDDVSYKVGHINAPETNTSGATEVHLLYDDVPDTLSPPKNAQRVKWVFLTVVAPTKKEAFTAYQQGQQLIRSNDQLYVDHVQAWGDLWRRGRVDVDNHQQLSRVLFGAQYNLLSSLPLQEDFSWPYVGLSPSGLPFGDYSQEYWDYQGHVFWDQETWMFPPILTMHADLARILIKTRERTKDAAAANAKLNNKQGLMYPWESAFTGTERRCVLQKALLNMKFTSSGDISLAFQQYLDMTGDVNILHHQRKNELTNVTGIITGIADYWVSQLKYNSTLQAYTILDVIPPDEYAKQVNNSAYTNSVAQVALGLPKKAFASIGRIQDRWQHFSDNIYVPFDAHANFHPEYDGYVKGTKVKQADVVMLGFPLLRSMQAETRKNDLKIYEQVTSVVGPAMSWAMFTIGWLEVGEQDKAAELFRKNYYYVKNAFQVWTETTQGNGATNFITGMGGFLQSVINGYGGVRIHDDSLHINPIPPPDAQGLHLVGLDYRGCSFNIFARVDEVMIVLTSAPSGAPVFKLYLENPEESHELSLNITVRYAPRPAIIKYTNDAKAA